MSLAKVRIELTVTGNDDLDTPEDAARHLDIHMEEILKRVSTGKENNRYSMRFHDENGNSFYVMVSLIAHRDD